MRYYFRENARRYEIMTRMGLEDWATQMYGGIDFHDFSCARCGSQSPGEGQAPALQCPISSEILGIPLNRPANADDG